MPNGGSDNCGTCAFNPLSLHYLPDQRPVAPGRCEIRGIATTSPMYTYCANYHTGSRRPDGPVFAGFHEFGRLPWDGDRQLDDNQGEDGPCSLCGETPSHLALTGADSRTLFCGPEHYLDWWRAARPGESGDYPWALHEAMFDARRRASGMDKPRGVRERLLSWLRR